MTTPPELPIEEQLAAEADRRRALERQWQESNERIERALQELRAGSFSWHPDEKRFECSDGFALLHGFEPAQTAPGIPDIFDRVPEEQRQSVLAQVREARKQRFTFDVTYPVVWPDGSEHWVNTRGTWTFAANATTASLFGIALDADKRILFEQQLAESERRRRAAQAAGGVEVWDFDFVNQVANVSDEYLRMHGFEEASYSVDHYRQFVPAEDLAMQQAAVARLSVTSPTYEVEHRITHAKTGGTRWVHGRGTARFDDEGNLVRLFGTTQDVTERKQAETALLDSTRIFRTLTQASPTLVFRTDERGEITFLNDERWQQFSGRAARAWEQRGWLEAFHEEDRSRAVAELAAATESRSPYEGEFRWQHVNGEVRWLLFHALPVHGDEGFTGFVGTAVNVTALKESEQERANLQLALANSQKLEAIGTLASGVAHDFNNLLAGVRGFIELASLEVDAASPASQYLDRALAAINQARDVTAGLLTFARRERSDRRVFAVNELIAENVEFLRKLVPASISIETDIGDSELTVHADPSQLRQVLVNLIVNARDAMPDGGHLQVTLTGRDGHAELLVRDDGQGMDEVTAQRIFEPFFTTKPHGHGTGLGMSIVHGIVTDHGGQVDVHSTPDNGTSVTVRLPLSDDAVQNVQSDSLTSPSGTGQQVLVVEDNSLVRESCVLRMQAAGFSAHGVGDGEEALAEVVAADARGQPFDTVLIDVDLPGQNGVAVAREIRTRRPDIPVVYITGNMQNQALHNIDGETVLAKPLDFQELFSTLNALLTSPAPGDG